MYVTDPPLIPTVLNMVEVAVDVAVMAGFELMAPVFVENSFTLLLCWIGSRVDFSRILFNASVKPRAYSSCSIVPCFIKRKIERILLAAASYHILLVRIAFIGTYPEWIHIRTQSWRWSL